MNEPVALPVRAPARVRPYAPPGTGRTGPCWVLLLESFVATAELPPRRTVRRDGPQRPLAERGLPEARAIVELCRRTRTVAEISALLRIPLGVVRVLLSELADQGRIRVHGTGHGLGPPDHALLERVLGGLRRL
ncbi:DUF742 domain-containing protein [Streptomyces sp. Z26]|uniref:DUF742 domain-containing protein n=1 Tax=Streptomyces TaxID=1883 RepID=UPI001404710F|nr:DUF742 domain-containing protein [Streptomyces sp. Z26]